MRRDDKFFFAGERSTQSIGRPDPSFVGARGRCYRRNGKEPARRRRYKGRAPIGRLAFPGERQEPGAGPSAGLGINRRYKGEENTEERSFGRKCGLRMTAVRRGTAKALYAGSRANRRAEVSIKLNKMRAWKRSGDMVYIRHDGAVRGGAEV